MKPAFLFNNLGLKLSSLLVAGVLWAAAQGFQSVELSLDLPIAFSDTPETVVVVGQSVSEVNLRLKGSRAALRSVAEEFSIFPISLVGLEPGTREFVIDTESLPLPRGAEVVARSPSKVELRIEPVIRKRVVIRADIVGALPDGYQIQGIELTPHEVVLEGARGSLRRLREISTRTVDVSGLTETTSQQVPLVLEAGQVWRVGARGEPVEVKILIQAPDNGTEPE
jgi:YbbR domain-containing protein